MAIVHHKRVSFQRVSWFLLSVTAASGLTGSAVATPLETPDLDAMKWRFVGPMIGGRVNAGGRPPNQENRCVRRVHRGRRLDTPDAGSNWVNVSDGYIRTGSIGGIDISRRIRTSFM